MTDHSCLILDAALFGGIEQEGPRKGIHTLFVATETLTISQLSGVLTDAVLKGRPFDQVYFGAGRLQPINRELLDWTLRETNLLVTVEVPDLGALDVKALLQEWEIVAPKNRILVVVTPWMMTKDQAIVSDSMDVSGDILLLVSEYPDSVAMKIDTGERVTIIMHTRTYSNDFETTDYGSDYRIEVPNV